MTGCFFRADTSDALHLEISPYDIQVLATYVHNIDPVIFSISDAIKLRWYGMAYLLAFVVGFFILKKLADKKLWVLPGEKTSDFITLAAIFGVFLGGRIGNIIFYQWDDFMASPSMIFKVWEGGMASHGGILGIMIFTLIYSRMKKVSWTGLGDGISVVAPLGIMFGRIANFINGELYGRIDRTHSWAMKFPLSLGEDASPAELRSLEAQLKPYDITVFHQTENIQTGEIFNHIHYNEITAGVRQSEQVREAVSQFIEPRYPSQLFQAAGEGLCLFLILFITRICFKRLPHGILTGMFFFFYAIFRITMENFRQQETADVTFLGTTFTMGQFLSLFMIVIGLGFIIQAMMRPRYLDGFEGNKR